MEYDRGENSSDPNGGVSDGMPNFSSNLTGWGVGGLSNILGCRKLLQYQYQPTGGSLEHNINTGGWLQQWQVQPKFYWPGILQ